MVFVEHKISKQLKDGSMRTDVIEVYKMMSGTNKVNSHSFFPRVGGIQNQRAERN